MKFKNSNSLLFCLYLLIIPLIGFSQRIHSDRLEYQNLNDGLKGLPLGSDIKEVPVSQLSYLDGISTPDTEGCFKYQIKDSTLLKNNNQLYINLVAIRTFNNKIVNIYLFFKRADGYLVLRDFLTSYGVFTSKPNDYVDIYDWNSLRISLSLRYELRTDLGVAIYTFKPLEQKIIQAKYLKSLLNFY